jgi:cell division protein FtsZ
VVATGIASEAAQHPKPVITLVGANPPTQRPIATAAQPAPFRPQVVTAAAAQPMAQAEPAVARASAPASMGQAALRQAEPELDIRQPEPRPEPVRPEPVRGEPSLRAEPSFARPDMAALGKAVAEIADSVAAAQPQHQPQPQPEPRRGAASLFDRLVRNRQQPAPQPQPEPQPHHRAPVMEEPMAAPQPRLEKSAPPRGGEDLDIPAFLRRQAN